MPLTRNTSHLTKTSRCNAPACAQDLVELVHHSLDAMTYHGKLPESLETDGLLYRRLVRPEVHSNVDALPRVAVVLETFCAVRSFKSNEK